MIHIIRRVALAAAVLAVAACTVPQSGTVAERGIGGTGAPAQAADRGIGGTGVETGIVGAITGFGSVRVNGLEIADDTLRAVSIDGVARPVGSLLVGQIASIIAITDERDSAAALRARSVAIEHEVLGPVRRVLGPDRFDVAGQTVRVTPGTAGMMPAIGKFLAVSGLRDGNGVVTATRLDAAPSGEVIVAGHLMATRAGWRIGDLAIDAPRGTPHGGQRVRVVGRLAGGVLVPRMLVADPIVPALTAPSRLIVQAFVQVSGDEIQLGEDAFAARGPDFGAQPPPGPAVVSMSRAADGHLTAIGLLGGGESSGRGGPGGALADPAAHAPAPGSSPGVAAAAAGHAGTNGGASGGTGGPAGTGGAAPGSPQADAATVGAAPASRAGLGGQGFGGLGVGGHGGGGHGGGGHASGGAGGPRR